MFNIRKNSLELSAITLLLVVSLFFRFKGISTNHSFWADEALVSSFSRDIALGGVSVLEGMTKIPYQSLQIGTVAFFFKVFGISEWSARLPSVLWGSLGTIFAYLLARRYSNKWGGFLTAFLYTFLQLNLAYSTQAKPYAAIETLFLISLYFANRNIYISSLCAVFATLYNYIGLITFIPILIQSTKYIKKITMNKYVLLIVSALFAMIVWILIPKGFVSYILNPQFNWITYARELFWRQYAFLTLPAVFGIFLVKDKRISVGIILSSITLLFFWNFIFYSHNVRYLMPIFGTLIVLFGIFWGRVGEVLFKNPAFICISVAILIFAGGYKVVRKPSVYYTPNADFFADVQNADYKSFFSEVYKKFPEFDKYPVFSDLYDPFAWYSTKKPDALFMKVISTPIHYSHYPVMAYPNLEYFLIEISKYPQGYLMVEDWQSFTPDDVKEYVKKNLKLEIRVESMSVSPNDKWPLELYSWGM